MKRLFVLATVVVLLALMVSSVSAHIVIDPPDPDPDVVPTDQISLNNIVIDPPAEDVVSDGTVTPLGGGVIISINVPS